MHEAQLISLKQQLLHACLKMQETRVALAKKAMDEAQQAANSEERSTAGDKYDTARARNQNSRDMNAIQLQEALNDLAVLKKINPALISNEVRLGSIVKTNAGNYFIALSGGPFNIDKEVYFSISIKAPIAQIILNKKKGDTFLCRGKAATIQEVF